MLVFSRDIKDIFFDGFRIMGGENTLTFNKIDELAQFAAPRPQIVGTFKSHSASTIVNYVWMNKEPGNPQPIPSELFYWFQKNAVQYPDVQFNLWTEDTSAYKDYFLPSNVVPQKLSSIPSFLAMPIMSSNDSDHIWAKVDIARLLVVQHMLKTTNADVAVYSDFDVPDIGLNSKRFQKRIDKFGMVWAGSTDNPKPDGYGAILAASLMGRFENGFFAFTPATSKALDLIVDRINKKSSKEDFQERSKDRDYIFFEKLRGLRQYAWAVWDKEKPFPLFTWQERVSCFPVQHHRFHKVDEKFHARMADEAEWPVIPSDPELTKEEIRAIRALIGGGVAIVASLFGGELYAMNAANNVLIASEKVFMAKNSGDFAQTFDKAMVDGKLIVCKDGSDIVTIRHDNTKAPEDKGYGVRIDNFGNRGWGKVFPIDSLDTEQDFHIKGETGAVPAYADLVAISTNLASSFVHNFTDGHCKVEDQPSEPVKATFLPVIHATLG